MIPPSPDLWWNLVYLPFHILNRKWTLIEFMLTCSEFPSFICTPSSLYLYLCCLLCQPPWSSHWTFPLPNPKLLGIPTISFLSQPQTTTNLSTMSKLFSNWEWYMECAKNLPSTQFSVYLCGYRLNQRQCSVSFLSTFSHSITSCDPSTAGILGWEFLNWLHWLQYAVCTPHYKHSSPKRLQMTLWRSSSRDSPAFGHWKPRYFLWISLPISKLIFACRPGWSILHIKLRDKTTGVSGWSMQCSLSMVEDWYPV